MRISPKIIKLSLISFLAGILMIYGALFAIFQANRHKLDEAIQKGLNGVFKGTVSKSNVSFSILNSFPYPTIHLRLLRVEDELSGAPVTVLECNSLDLRFSIAALIKKDIEVVSLTIKSLHLSEVVNDAGFTSKLIFRAKDQSATKEVRNISIPHFKVGEFSFERIDDVNGNSIKISEAEVFGKVYTENENRIIHLFGQGELNHFTSNFRKIVDQADFQVEGEITLFSKVPGLNFESKKLLVEGYPLALEGLIRNVNDTAQYREIHISGRDTSVKLLLFFLPDSLKSMLVHAPDMNSSVALSYSGLQNKNLRPLLTLNAEVKNAHLKTKDNAISIEKINVLQSIKETGVGADRKMNVVSKLSADANIKYIDIENLHPTLTIFVDRFQNPNTQKEAKSDRNDEYDVSMRLNLKADTIKYLDAYIRNLTGYVLIDSSIVTLNNVNGKIAKGSFLLNAQLRDENQVNAQLSVSKVNLQNLMKSFRNFDQKFILDQHLSGSASFDLEAKSRLTSKNIPILKQTKASGILHLHAPSLKDWPVAVTALKPFIGEDSRQLRTGETTVKFSLKNGELAIPVFTLQSNISEVKVGMHTKDEFEYLLFKLNAFDQVRSLRKGSNEPIRKKKDQRLEQKRFADVHMELTLKDGKFVEKNMLKRQSYDSLVLKLNNRWKELKE